MAQAQQASPQLLYRFLRIGVTILAVIFLVLRYSGFAPLMPTTDGSLLVSYVMAGITVALLLVAAMVLKPRVPTRRPGQSSSEYWSTPAIVKQAMTVWFVIEGAGTLAAVGFLMTGHAATGAAMALAITVFWIIGPEAFERA